MTDDNVTLNSHLIVAIKDYLQWKKQSGLCQRTLKNYARRLIEFLEFISQRKIEFYNVFTWEILQDYKKYKKIKQNKYYWIIKELSRYLYKNKKILFPIIKPVVRLPDRYEDYLVYAKRTKHAQDKRIRKIITKFNDYLKKSNITLTYLKIEQVDEFLTEFNLGLAPESCKIHRTCLKGFLNYLYYECGILKRNLAPLVVGAPVFAKSKPPKFLRENEIQKIFDIMDYSSPPGLRAYAAFQLAYALGLRPKEISQLTLDDIFFSEGEININGRKGDNPVKLPLPECVVKSLTAYVIEARPNSKCRTLFLNFVFPHRPLVSKNIGTVIKELMHKAGLDSSAYWLRHTYAQNLLESGVTTYEIAEMMGHDTIETTKKYLSINIKLMREVLFDE